MLLTSHRCELSSPDGDGSSGEPGGGVEDPAGKGAVGASAVDGSAGACPAASEGPRGDSSLTASTYSEGCVGGSSAPMIQNIGRNIPIKNMIQ
jgi:hypothetical protein